MFFQDLPIGARFDDSMGATWIKIEELKQKIGDSFYARNAIVIQSPHPESRPGHSGYIASCLGKYLVYNVVLPEAQTAR